MSFLKELQDLTKPAPALPDLEDDEGNESAVATKAVHGHESSEGVNHRRIRNAFCDDDEKYSGSKVSRSDIFGDSSEIMGISSNGKDDDSDDDDDAVSDEDLDEEEDKDEDVEASIGDVDEEEDESGIEDEEESGIEDEEEEGGEEEGGGEEDEQSEVEEGDETVDDTGDDGDKLKFKDLVSSVDKDHADKKAESIKRQMAIWDQLLFVKIKLQSALHNYNQLPRGQLAKDLVEKSDQDTKDNYEKIRENMRKIYSRLLESEDVLLRTCALTKGILGEEGAADSDDEEIESSEDEKEEDDDVDDGDEDSLIDDGSDAEDTVNGNATIGWKTAEKRLIANNDRFKKFRTKTIAKWDERTRLVLPRKMQHAKRDFSAFEKGGVNVQITKLMADKAKQLKRFHSKRSDNDRIGGDPEADEDEEIFDDDDFYQILLKDMIEKKSNIADDPVAMTRHYIEMQKLRNKRSKKREFDHRLSKERKIKYVPIPKLVNFHPSRPEIVKWSHETRNELFKSLFK